MVNTAVFEHVRNRDTLEEIESYVSDTGCIGNTYSYPCNGAEGSELDVFTTCTLCFSYESKHGVIDEELGL